MTFTARVLMPSLNGDTRSRLFDIEADDFLHAVELAEGVREDDERLVSVALVVPAQTSRGWMTVA